MATTLILKEDLELLTKVLKITIAGDDAPAAPARGGSGSGGEPGMELAELRDELKAEAGEATSAEAVAARWADVASRRSLFDRALVGRLSEANAPVVDYLVGCFSRCVELRSRKGSAVSAEQAELFEYVSDLCVSYSKIALQNPSMFPQPADAEAEGVLRLLRSLKDDSLPGPFLKSLVAKFEEEGALAELGLPLFAKLAEEASKNQLYNADFGPYRALYTLVREKALGALFATDPSFLPPLCLNGAMLQAGARLGPFFGLACFPSELAVVTQAFPDVQNPIAIEQSISGLRSGSQLVQRALLQISKELLKNPDAKEPFFRFVAASCALNGARKQQFFPHLESARLLHLIAPQVFEPQGGMRQYSHDGMLFNLGAVLLQLCDPFTAPNSPHAAKIDGSYLLSPHRLSMKDETRLCATTDDVAHWLDPRNPDLAQRYRDRMRGEGHTVDPDASPEPPLQVAASFGTISEYFFLTMRVLHVGVLPSFTLLEQLMKDNSRQQQELTIRERDLMMMRSQGGGGPMVAQLDAAVTAQRKWIEGLKQCILAFQGELGDPALVLLMIRYYRLVCRWLISAANAPPEGLPLPETVPRLFAALPEFCMDDITTYLDLVTRLAPQAFEQISPDELHDFVTLIVTFIGAPKYVKNPYLRATFTKLLAYLVPSSHDDSGRRHASDRLSAVFHSHALAQQWLAPGLMQFFVDIEFSGSHTGAYDKYQYRHEMAQVLEYFWEQPVYKATMVGFARDLTRFIRFINMLINDSIFAMSEALDKLKEIKEVQLEMADEAGWQAQDQRRRQQRAHEHQRNEGHAGYFMLFTNEVMHMMSYLSSEKEVALVFMVPELAPRISQMLNHFLVDLVGPKCSNLKVKDPEKYHFHPRQLLHEIVTIILHFAPFPEFELAMVRDERSFDPGNLRKAVRVLGRSATDLTVRPEQLQALEAFASRCVEVKESVMDEEEELGEVPDDFLDPITQELMSDPVRLPSGNVCDRAVITRHLLSDETDPFNRARLTVDMLVDDAELKAKIAEWKAGQRRASGGGGAAAGGASAMEVGD